jgi:hypothetical protein
MSNGEQLLLSDIWRPRNVDHYKVHFARWNQSDQPVRVLARSISEWQSWQEWYPSKNDFNRPYIFSLAQMPEAKEYWVFGGIWKVLGTETRSDGRQYYQVALDDDLRSLEAHYEHFVVSEILAEKYTGRSFPGFHAVNLSFQELEGLMAHNRKDWETALSHVKGVYLITDTKSQKRYVGSAYGELGIWSRWCDYIHLGHGGNEGMRDLLKGHDLDYCRRHFKFALLEHRDARTDDAVILDRETFWKQVLDTRHAETGLNRN